jgi:NAD(P)-dependent dehydrogenase (short-subunit alcohol dehydrogenase family)
VEGWSEDMSFELALHKIRINIISPGGTVTDFTGRSLQVAEHDAYSGLFQQLLSGQEGVEFAPAEVIAEVVYAAATDPQDRLRYPAGPDAVAAYTQRQVAGPEGFWQGVAAQFGLPTPAM